MNEPQPWACAYCGGRLQWTATTVGCRPCRTVVTLPGHPTPDEQDQQQ